MKKAILFLAFSFLCIKLILSQSWQYAKMYGGSSLSLDRPLNLEVDTYGNSYVFGNYGSDAEFNDSILPHFNDNRRGSYLAKFDCNGNILWSKTVANASNSEDVANYMILKDSILYLSGTCTIAPSQQVWFLDTVFIHNSPDNPDPPVYPWITNNKYTYLLKVDLNGNILDFNLFHLNIEEPDDLVSDYLIWNPIFRTPFHIDNDGNIYLLTNRTNNYPTTLCINGIEVCDIIPEDYYFSTYLIKCDSECNFIWIKSLYEEISEPESHKLITNILDLASDSDNNLYLVGYIESNSIGGAYYQTPTTITIIDNHTLHTYKKGDYVSILYKLNENGDYIWAKQTESYNVSQTASYSKFTSIIINEESNNIFVGGNAMAKTTTIPGVSTIYGEQDTLTNYLGLEHALPYLGIIANYDLDGNYKWVKTANSYRSEIGFIDFYENNLYAGTEWRTTLIHGTQTIVNDLYTNNFSILSWDIDGNPINLIESSENGDPQLALCLYGIKHSINGDIIVNGMFKNNFILGTNSLTNLDFKPFIAKYGNSPPIYNDYSLSICYGDEYNGIFFTESGQYQIILESSTPNIDSIINLNLTVSEPLSTGIPDTIICTNELYTFYSINDCNTYQWSTGSQTYSEELFYPEEGQYFVYVTLTDDYCSGIDTILIKTQLCTNTNGINVEEIEISPNPTQNILNIKTSNYQQIKNYSIIDNTGKTVLNGYPNSIHEISIPLNDLTPGVYTIVFKTNISTYTKTFIKT